MSLFDTLVDSAIRNVPEAAALRPVVEKELLHHDIIREMSSNGLLQELVFMGGTCLRTCYGSVRLSGDLDFSATSRTASPASSSGQSRETRQPGKTDTVPELLSELATVVTETLTRKYDIPVTVTPPHRDEADVFTWKVRMTTHPERPDLPSQRIHIDVQTIPSRQSRPATLKNPYRIDMGTFGLILNAEPLEEILVDKIIAFANRPNRVKNRDIWDITWLHQQAVSVDRELLIRKLQDRGIDRDSFGASYRNRADEMVHGYDAFLNEMRRFIPPQTAETTFAQPRYWEYVSQTIRDMARTIR